MSYWITPKKIEIRERKDVLETKFLKKSVIKEGCRSAPFFHKKVNKLIQDSGVIGDADIWIIACCAILTGVLGGFITLLVGSILSAVLVTASRLISKKKMTEELAFGPFLIV